MRQILVGLALAALLAGCATNMTPAQRYEMHQQQLAGPSPAISDMVPR